MGNDYYKSLLFEVGHEGIEKLLAEPRSRLPARATTPAMRARRGGRGNPLPQPLDPIV
jgi:hypothetical protein